jgi:hypothetical protein
VTRTRTELVTEKGGGGCSVNRCLTVKWCEAAAGKEARHGTFGCKWTWVEPGQWGVGGGADRTAPFGVAGLGSGAA